VSCSLPVSWEVLVAYWAGDLAAADVDRIDEHLMGCESCSAESARVCSIALAIREVIPPVVTQARLQGLRARGLRIEENEFAPGQRKTVFFPRGVDLLVHHLVGLDLSNAQRVRVIVRTESTGEVRFDEPNAPFDAREGILIACQQHFRAMPPDTVFEVRAIEASGAERTAIYAIPHVFED
jgi:hypothetical protein